MSILADLGHINFNRKPGAIGKFCTFAVQNALQEFLFFLPISNAYSYNADDEQEFIKLRKRIYKDGSNYYLLVGAKVGDLAGLPAGDVYFDPTIDDRVL